METLSRRNLLKTGLLIPAAAAARLLLHQHRHRCGGGKLRSTFSTNRRGIGEPGNDFIVRGAQRRPRAVAFRFWLALSLGHADD